MLLCFVLILKAKVRSLLQKSGSIFILKQAYGLLNFALIRKSFFFCLCPPLHRLLRGRFVFLGLGAGEKLLWEIFKLHRSFASGLHTIVVRNWQRAERETLLCGLGAPEKMRPASLRAPLRTTAPHTAGVTDCHENIGDTWRRVSGSL